MRLCGNRVTVRVTPGFDKAVRYQGYSEGDTCLMRLCGNRVTVRVTPGFDKAVRYQGYSEGDTCLMRLCGNRRSKTFISQGAARQAGQIYSWLFAKNL